MLTIACVLKSGGIYDASWVERLQAGVARHLASAHRFLCLSDVDVPCERIALEHDWPGWWSKIEAFKLPGPVLYFDLDTAIVGDLSEIAASIDWQLMALTDFYRGDGIGSGVMAWAYHSGIRALYDWFSDDAKAIMESVGGRGDQGAIEEFYKGDFGSIARWQMFAPGQVVSYKRHCRAGVPDNARVVCLHGPPKFADMPASDPVRIAWEMAA